MAGTTNFLQTNPSAANQEDDGTYAADSLTTGGVGVDDILPSPWLNKVWFQCTTFICALAYVIANWGGGYTITDTSLATLKTNLTNFFTSLGGLATATRTNKTGTYLAGTTYTNSTGAAVFEEVTMAGPGGGGTGSDHTLRATIDGSPGPSSGISNAANGYAYIGFWVPNGKTFSVAITDTSGTSTINQWTEVSF